MADREIISSIREIKARSGSKLVILGHHYQRREIVELSDFVGDSFELSRLAAKQVEAEHIVFCGVHFMAESAYLLAPEGRTVQLPDITAGCPMADMAMPVPVERTWAELCDVCGPDAFIPIVYMNSLASLKAFCGRNGGAVCTSGNAQKILSWAFEQGKKVLFFPDEHLGRNTAAALEIPDTECVLWDSSQEMGGLDSSLTEAAQLVLWKGYCHVHQNFTVADVEAMRASRPTARILVHPECRREVVDVCDGAGSTAFLVREVKDAPVGSTICIGTEWHLVDRLAATYRDKEIVALRRSDCDDMAKITAESLFETLEKLGRHNVVQVAEEFRVDARKALQRMLDICD